VEFGIRQGFAMARLTVPVLNKRLSLLN
jgi:hypothetical protein